MVAVVAVMVEKIDSLNTKHKMKRTYFHNPVDKDVVPAEQARIDHKMVPMNNTVALDLQNFEHMTFSEMLMKMKLMVSPF